MAFIKFVKHKGYGDYVVHFSSTQEMDNFKYDYNVFMSKMQSLIDEVLKD